MPIGSAFQHWDLDELKWREEGVILVLEQWQFEPCHQMDKVSVHSHVVTAGWETDIDLLVVVAMMVQQQQQKHWMGVVLQLHLYLAHRKRLCR